MQVECAGACKDPEAEDGHSGCRGKQVVSDPVNHVSWCRGGLFQWWPPSRAVASPWGEDGFLSLAGRLPGKAHVEKP